ATVPPLPGSPHRLHDGFPQDLVDETEVGMIARSIQSNAILRLSASATGDTPVDDMALSRRIYSVCRCRVWANRRKRSAVGGRARFPRASDDADGPRPRQRTLTSQRIA